MLDIRKRNEEFRSLFGLPQHEELITKHEASISYKSTWVLGKIYLSKNFTCFHSLLQDDREELMKKPKSERLVGIRDGGVIADNSIKGRKGSAFKPFLKVTIPVTEVVELGFNNDGRCGFLISMNTKRNQVLIIVLFFCLKPNCADKVY